MIKPTLVIDGGGLKMSYGAGSMTGLADLGIKAEYFKEIYGTSAGGCIGAYYATNQIAEGGRIFKQHLPNKFIHWYGTDMAYLEKILREIEPLDVTALKKCTTKIYISLTNIESDELETFCLNDALDPVKVLLAGVSWKKPLS